MKTILTFYCHVKRSSNSQLLGSGKIHSQGRKHHPQGQFLLQSYLGRPRSLLRESRPLSCFQFPLTQMRLLVLLSGQLSRKQRQVLPLTSPSELEMNMVMIVVWRRMFGMSYSTLKPVVNKFKDTSPRQSRHRVPTSCRTWQHNRGNTLSISSVRLREA